MKPILPFMLLLAFCTAANAATRIKDIAFVQGVRENQLIGYGLVVGLPGTGDSMRNSPFTEQATQSMLDRMGMSLRGAQLRSRNIAAVLVTAELPPFVSRGSRIDVSVASIGDATSLTGGTLVMTPLMAADGSTYAVAQGALAVSGFAASGQNETVTQGVPTAARIANGALIEKELPNKLTDLPSLAFELRNPDYTTAVRVTDEINRYARSRFGRTIAEEKDLRTVSIARPTQIAPARLIAEIGELEVEPDQPARVVIDERTGTVVIGQDVQISTVAVTQGNLTVRVSETPAVSQPAARSNGETKVTSQTNISTAQQGGRVAVLSGASLRSLVNGLNQIGLKPMDIISILQAIKTAGALHAELVVQ